VGSEDEITLAGSNSGSDFADHAKIRLERRLYLLGLIVWLSLTILYPPWAGRIYDVYGAGAVAQIGAFGLRGADGWIKHGLLWNPPKPHSTVIVATPRMPWQPALPGYHVDLALALMATQYSVGVIALGIALRIAHWRFVRSKPDAFVSTALLLSILLSLAFLCIVVLGVLTMGYALTEDVIVGIWMAGVFIAFLYAISKFLLSLRVARR